MLIGTQYRGFQTLSLMPSHSNLLKLLNAVRQIASTYYSVLLCSFVVSAIEASNDSFVCMHIRCKWKVGYQQSLPIRRSSITTFSVGNTNDAISHLLQSIIFKWLDSAKMTVRESLFSQLLCALIGNPLNRCFEPLL